MIPKLAILVKSCIFILDNGVLIIEFPFLVVLVGQVRIEYCLQT